MNLSQDARRKGYYTRRRAWARAKELSQKHVEFTMIRHAANLYTIEIVRALETTQFPDKQRDGAE